MATQFQGFDKNLNLSEATADRDIINNLAGSPIGNDIGLFVNNLRNVSILTVTEDNIDGDTIVFPSTQPFVFSSGTIVTVDLENYRVLDSTGANAGAKTFRLETEAGVPVLNPPVGVYARSDAITLDNLKALRPIKKVTMENYKLSVFSNVVDSNVNPYTSEFLLYNAVTNSPDTFDVMLQEIESKLTVFFTEKNQAIFRNIDFTTDRVVTINRNFTVFDPDGTINNTSPLTDDKPGIYILNTVTDEIKRIFSSNDNVWSELGNTLVCASKEIVTGNLIFENEIKLTTSALGNLVTPITGIVETEFTHLARTIINGEEYYLCLLETT